MVKIPCAITNLPAPGNKNVLEIEIKILCKLQRTASYEWEFISQEITSSSDVVEVKNIEVLKSGVLNSKNLSDFVEQSLKSRAEKEKSLKRKKKANDLQLQGDVKNARMAPTKHLLAVLKRFNRA